MATQAAVSGQPTKNNTGKILGAGTISRTDFTSMSQITNLTNIARKTTLPISSTTLGNTTAISGRTFASQQEGYYVGMLIQSRIAGVADTTLKSGAGDFNRASGGNPYTGYQLLNITAWNAITGAATKGNAAGRTIGASGIDGTTGKTSDHAVPTESRAGEFVYNINVLNTPTQDDYDVHNG